MGGEQLSDMRLILSWMILFCTIIPALCQPLLRFSVKQLQRDLQSFNTAIDASRRVVEEKRYQPIKERNITTIDNENMSNCNVVRLYCRTRSYLSVSKDRVLGRHPNKASDEDIFQIESYGNSIIRLKNVKVNKYLKMTKTGHIELTTKKSEDSLFFQHLEETNYITFSSEKYYIYTKHDLFISVKRNGKIRLAGNTEPGQRSSQFLQINEEGKSCTK